MIKIVKIIFSIIIIFSFISCNTYIWSGSEYIESYNIYDNSDKIIYAIMQIVRNEKNHSVSYSDFYEKVKRLNPVIDSISNNIYTFKKGSSKYILKDSSSKYIYCLHVTDRPNFGQLVTIWAYIDINREIRYQRNLLLDKKKEVIPVFEKEILPKIKEYLEKEE